METEPFAIISLTLNKEDNYGTPSLIHNKWKYFHITAETVEIHTA